MSNPTDKSYEKGDAFASGYLSRGDHTEEEHRGIRNGFAVGYQEGYEDGREAYKQELQLAVKELLEAYNKHTNVTGTGPSGPPKVK